MSVTVDVPTPLLEVDQLRISVAGPAGPLEVVHGVSFSLAAGDTLGLIGESGCGKSITALALMGLLPEGAHRQGEIRWAGQALTAGDEVAWTRVRGAQIGMVFQEPMTALNPLHPIGQQIGESLRWHRGVDAATARAQALRWLERVRLPHAAKRLDAYPHELSGGQRQRVMLAMALACGPRLLIADEPTTALDATVRREVLDLIEELVAEQQMALILISHDLALMAHRVKRLMVMYAGLAVEQGPAAQLFASPRHPYTHGLFAARPRWDQPRGEPLATIPGRVPAAGERTPGCAFAPRCARASADCQATPPTDDVLPHGHAVRCLHPLAGSALAR
ncbi:ABC transporter ATP-binding protein [Ideonella sp. DXS29W]|uniref:ABC transporter ATP-binding protein n=1 Tax=Ideonella lacteola TaxID=2984193 RepID=A0ABU9BKI9_9BURK